MIISKIIYRLIAVDLSRQRELDADPNPIQPVELVRQSKHVDDEYNAVNADGTQNMIVLTILEKIKETRLKFSQGGVTVL